MKKGFIAMSLLLLLLVPTSLVFADITADRVVGEDDPAPDEVIVIDDNVEIESGGRVNGDVVVINGNAKIAGTVRGSLVVFNGDVELVETAVIRDECIIVNGTLTGTNQNCTVISDFPLLTGIANRLTDIPSVRPPTRVPSLNLNGFWSKLAGTVGRTLFFGLIAFGIGSALPKHVQQVQNTMQNNIVASGTVGFLTSLAGISLLLLSGILILVCIGIPLTFALMVILAAGISFGWVTVGNSVGHWLVNKLNIQIDNQAVIIAIGTMLLTFVLGLLGAIPYVFGEGLLAFAIVCVGLGAVALTKFGTRPFPAIVAPVGNSDKITAVLETLPDEE